MAGSQSIVLYTLLLAHLLADFVFQPKSWVESRKLKGLKGSGYWKHIGTVGILTAIGALPLLMPSMKMDIYLYPMVIGIVTLSHAVIDAWKDSLKKPNHIHFVVDQILHWTVIGLVYIGIMPSEEGFNVVERIMINPIVWKCGLAIIWVLWPTRFMIEVLIKGWKLNPNEEVKDHIAAGNRSAYVGYLERLLILGTLYAGKFEGIGFLFAAKSVFRFADLKDEHDRAKAEYILIGTLLSFTSAVAIGMLLVGDWS